MSYDLDEIPENAESEFEESDTEPGDGTQESLTSQLEAALGVLRRNAILFEYLSAPEYCRGINKSIRTNIDKQVERIWNVVEESQEVLDEIEEDASET